MNALNAQIQEGLVAACAEVSGRKDIAAVIVYGGEKVFAAGADIKEMQHMSYTDMVDHSGLLCRQLHPGPGPASPSRPWPPSPGTPSAAAASSRWRATSGSSAEAPSWGSPRSCSGSSPEPVAPNGFRVSSDRPRPRTSIFSGRFVGAEEALAIGLVDEVVDDDQVYPPPWRRMTAYVGGPAYALRAAKEAIDRGLEVDLAAGLEIERMQFAALFATRDRTIGMRSFVENGPGKARFEGA